MTEDLYVRARQMGVDAAREMHTMNVHEKPLMVRSPHEHVRYLLGRDGTSEELRLVWTAWEEGVEEFWGRRFHDLRN